MRLTTCVLLMMLAGPAAATPAAAPGRLEIHAGPATIDATAAHTERRLVTLPALEFPLRLKPACATGTAVESVSVTAADTRLVFTATDFASGQALETTLRLPAQQLAPLALTVACAASEPGASDTSLLVPGAFSAHASLLCSGESSREMIYATLALAVKLVCPPPGESSAPAAGDQASPAGSASF